MKKTPSESPMCANTAAVDSCTPMVVHCNSPACLDHWEVPMGGNIQMPLGSAKYFRTERLVDIEVGSGRQETSAAC